MAEELFSAGGQIAANAAGTAVDQNLKQKETLERGAEVSQKQGADIGEISMQQKAQMALEKLRASEDQVTITPQIALGLVKNTGNKDWLTSIGTKMRSDVLLGMYSHGINAKFAGKEYKVPVGDKIVTMVPKYNSDTADWDFEAIGEGEKFSPTAKGEDTPKAKADRSARSGKGGSGIHEDPKDKEFLKTYRQNLKDTEGMNYTLLDQLAKKDPKQASDMRSKLDFIQKNSDRFNKLQGVKPPAPDDTGTSKKYASAEEVRAAFKAGTLKRDEAKKILSDQFGMK